MAANKKMNIDLPRSLMANKANQHGPLKTLRKEQATLLTPSYLRRYKPKDELRSIKLKQL